MLGGEIGPQADRHATVLEVNEERVGGVGRLGEGLADKGERGNGGEKGAAINGHDGSSFEQVRQGMNGSAARETRGQSLRHQRWREGADIPAHGGDLAHQCAGDMTKARG